MVWTRVPLIINERNFPESVSKISGEEPRSKARSSIRSVDTESSTRRLRKKTARAIRKLLPEPDIKHGAKPPAKVVGLDRYPKQPACRRKYLLFASATRGPRECIFQVGRLCFLRENATACTQTCNQVKGTVHLSIPLRSSHFRVNAGPFMAQLSITS